MKGYVHSTESFGTVDGPGIRYVLFMQGCPMRCLYCHNPDTWSMMGGREVSAEEIISEYKKNQAFYRGGGITVTGGEPLLQVDFLIELFRLAKERGIHTCIDTSGITYSESNYDYIASLDVLMQYTDLVLLDVKHIDSDKHVALTGKENSHVVAFAKYLERKGIPVWIRHVVVRGYTDDEQSLISLGKFIGSLTNVRALEVLPYHNMGEAKYKALGIDYKLRGTQPTTSEEISVARKHIVAGIREIRRAHPDTNVKKT